MSELRKDPIIGRWVIISPERAKRPFEYKVKPDEIVEPALCPFCPGSEAQTPDELYVEREPGGKANAPGWRVRVIPNKFPALRIEEDEERAPVGMFDKMNGIGAHEVIIESPEHSSRMALFEIRQVEAVLRCYSARISDLKKDQRLKYVLIFKNHGREAGASISHPHSQLIATPIVPKRVKEEIEGARRYYDYKERCVYCDILVQELKEQVRVIFENTSFVAIAPFAPRFPFESWILPKKHISNFEAITYEELPDLAEMLLILLAKLDKHLNNPPFNYLIHNNVTYNSSLPYYHWHIEIIPKLIHAAGFEWGTGFFINPVAPEVAAAQLKQVVI